MKPRLKLPLFLQVALGVAVGLGMHKAMTGAGKAAPVDRSGQDPLSWLLERKTVPEASIERPPVVHPAPSAGPSLGMHLRPTMEIQRVASHPTWSARVCGDDLVSVAAEVKRLRKAARAT